MNEIGSVELVERWVFADLSSSTFSRDEQRRVLDDIDRLEEHLTTWNRSLTNCVEILSNTESETIYRQRSGDLRSYFVRRGNTLYCVGVGKRKTTYDRDLTRVIERVNEYRGNS